MAFITVVLFLSVGSAWMIEIGGLEKDQLQHLKTTMKSDLEGREYMGKYIARYNADIPNSEKAPPVSAIAPLLDVFSSWGYSILSHNDEYKQGSDMNYLTWVLNKDA